jgi:hypothetical protein
VIWVFFLLSVIFLVFGDLGMLGVLKLLRGFVLRFLMCFFYCFMDFCVCAFEVIHCFVIRVLVCRLLCFCKM